VTRAVVVPFGVPDESSGLGLGLASVLHAFAVVGGQNVALAQLFSAANEDAAGGTSGPRAEAKSVEALIPPHAWKDLAARGSAPNDVDLVLSGGFEPPRDGARGQLDVIIFEAKTGIVRARQGGAVDEAHAGRDLSQVLSALFAEVGGGLGSMEELQELSWEPLESVLQAERCLAPRPNHNAAYDGLAAMAHLERAVGEAPGARYPAGRLAVVALETALGSLSDTKLADAALRSLSRAATDAPEQLDLVEATAALELRLGRVEQVEARLAPLAELKVLRPRVYTLLSEVYRATNRLRDAERVVRRGVSLCPPDPVLGSEHGIVLHAAGDTIEARAAWMDVLGHFPLFPTAFTHLADAVLEGGDTRSASRMVDDALNANRVHPEVLRKARSIIERCEAPGLPRASRTLKLTTALRDVLPQDPECALDHARALAQTGDKPAALRELGRAMQLAPGSAVAAEAQRGRFAITEPALSKRVDELVALAYRAEGQELEHVVALGQGLGTELPVWSASFALGVAERRLGHLDESKRALLRAAELGPGSAAVHMELSTLYLALKDPKHALEHAVRAQALDGDTGKTLAVLATAHLANGNAETARALIDRSLAMDGQNQSARALREKLSNESSRGPGGRIREFFQRFRGGGP
jgi:tetratricopeptide (TPR) repeat protein